MKLKFIYFTYDAISQIMQDRRFLSIEFPEGDALCRCIIEETESWSHPIISRFINKRNDGVIFHTSGIDRENGFLFDLESFDGFDKEKENLKNISSILIKCLRYAVKYFSGSFLSQNEVLLRDKNQILVYPYPFTRTKDVPKVVIDLNNSPEATRKSLKILTAFSYQTTPDKSEISYRNLMKMLEDLKEISINKRTQNHQEQEGILSVSNFDDAPSLSLNAGIGFSNWQQYLTNSQKDFIYKDFTGPERLEGPAGSGKTLSLCLRAIHLMEKALKENEPLNIIYFTHSEATKEQILECLSTNMPDFEYFNESQSGKGLHSINVTTLQAWCAHHLGINDLSDNEYIDKDAGNSKIYQLLYIDEAWNNYWKDYGDIAGSRISREFSEFIENTPEDIIIEILQREFSEVIKGQAKSNLDRYLALKRPLYAMSLANDSDKKVVFDVFNNYQNKLVENGQFDSDDIVISAMGQIDSPIWRRRLSKEGYDICFIDETHLFNLNEISIFHFINKQEKRNNIIFCIDRSQSIGDSYRADAELINNNGADSSDMSSSRYETLFRCSHDVAALAMSILTSGASMFTTFENPMTSYSTLSDDDIKKGEKPFIHLLADNDSMIHEVFDWAQKFVNRKGIKRNRVLIIGVDHETTTELINYARQCHKPYMVVNARGENAHIRKPINDTRFVIAGIDYVGGLEFDAVAIVGVDGNRVPPMTNQGKHIINFAWFNRLYVAVTRARYAVAMFGEQAGEISPLLEFACGSGFLEKKI